MKFIIKRVIKDDLRLSAEQVVVEWTLQPLVSVVGSGIPILHCGDEHLQTVEPSSTALHPSFSGIRLSINGEPQDLATKNIKVTKEHFIKISSKSYVKIQSASNYAIIANATFVTKA